LLIQVHYRLLLHLRILIRHLLLLLLLPLRTVKKLVEYG